MNKKVPVILIISVVIILVFSASISGMNNIKNSAQPVTKTNYASTAVVGQEIQSNSNTSNAGYVKYTLDLINNTLLKGNVPYMGNGIAPVALAYDSANGYIYVATAGLNTVSVINGETNTLIKNIIAGWGPDAVTYDSANGYIYVASSTSSSNGIVSDSVSVINGATNTVIKNITVGSQPLGMAFDSANGYIYVTNSGSNDVSVINGANNTVIGNIAVGSGPYAVAYDSANGYIYVARYTFNNAVSVINGSTNTVIKNIPIESYSQAVTFDPANGYVYVAGGSNTVSVINGANNTVIGNVPVGSRPDAILFDPLNGYIYVANQDSSNLSVINGATNSVIGSINVGMFPHGMAYDSSNGYIYVANFYSGTISIISTSVVQLYTVTFKENGLPAGATWYVNLSNGQSFSSMNSTIMFSEPNGTYAYTIGSTNKTYFAIPSSGSINVNGTSITKNVIFKSSLNKTTSTSSSISNTELYAIVGVIIAVIIIGIAVFVFRRKK